MKLIDFISKEELQKIQNYFSDATGLAAIIVDADGNYITAPSNYTDFCAKHTRGSQEGLRRCQKCDKECTGTYYCHAGLMDFSSDIIVEGEKLGTVIGGQVLPNQPDLDKFREMARELGINPERYVEAVKKVPVRSEKVIRAAAGMLGETINKMVNLAYMQSKGSFGIDVIQENVKNALEAVDSINEKTKFLQTVASRQNILTLNATIESARAGEAGKGFSVVATQMGDLSRKSSEIYKGITDDASAITKAITILNTALT